MASITWTAPRITGTSSLAAILMPALALSATPSFDGNPNYFADYRQVPELSEFVKRFQPYLAQVPELDRIKEIASLKDGWNGYGAKQIDESVLENGKSLVLELNKILIDSEVFPTLRSTLQVEFTNRKAEYIEIEILPNKYKVAVINKNSEQEFETENIGELISRVA